MCSSRSLIAENESERSSDCSNFTIFWSFVTSNEYQKLAGEMFASPRERKKALRLWGRRWCVALLPSSTCFTVCSAQFSLHSLKPAEMCGRKGNFSSRCWFFFCSFARLSACLPIMRSIPFRSIICRRLTFMKYSNYASLSPSLSSIQLSASGSFIGLNLSRNAVSDRKALKLSCPIMRTLASSYVLARKWRESKYASVYIVGICAKCVYGNVRLSRQLRLFWGDVEYATSYWLPLSSLCLPCTLMIKEKQLCEAINKLIKAKAGATVDDSFLSSSFSVNKLCSSVHWAVSHTITTQRA